MSERKVLNKYYPPDFDPSNIPKMKTLKNRPFNIRIMAPMNMRCDNCGEYIYKGKKFNSRKEDVEDEFYLGLRIFRFYIKCPRCVSEIAFKTDLANTDYTLEAGATRLFEAEKLARQMAEKEIKDKEDEELNNPMKVLENRTKASRKEIEQIDTLEELREMNARHAKVDHESMLKMHAEYEKHLKQLQEEEEQKEIKSIMGEIEGQSIKRLNDDEGDDGQQPPKKKLATVKTKATDILTVHTEEQPKKKVQVWEKSIGSVGQKFSLSKLVKSSTKKKTETSNGHQNVVVETCNSTTNVSAPSRKENERSTALGLLCKDNSTAKISVTLKQENERSSALGLPRKDNSTTRVSAPQKIEHESSSALGLLGNYSDSDSSDN